jgi:hypothetical protein
MNAQQLVELVQSHLDNAPPLAVKVVPEGVRQDGDWWTVPVRAAEEPKRQWRYYEFLAGIESELEEEDGVNVLLVPVS